MELNEMKKIWDSQNSETIFGINEQALHKRIISMGRSALHISEFSEWLVMAVNFVTGSFVLVINLFGHRQSVFLYLLGIWMLATALYVALIRIRRIRGEKQFDRTMRGDLEYAIATATNQVQLSRLMRWNILPIALMTLLGTWTAGKSLWFALALLVFFALTYLASGWEHGIYEKKRMALAALKSKLESFD